MKDYVCENLRNVAVIGHGRAGKTSLIEACLFDAEGISRMGKVEDGTTISDFEPEEIAREMSLSTAAIACEWKECKINFLDTPGYPDFYADVRGALRAADVALLVMSARSGVKPESAKVWQYATDEDMPRAIYINKMDKERADFYKVLNELRSRFGKGVVAIQLPIGQEASFQGVANILTLRHKSILHEEKFAKGEIPEYMEKDVAEARMNLCEALAEYNNSLMEKYIEGEEITEEELYAALVEGIKDRKVFPVFCGSATKNIGMPALMNCLLGYLPSPEANVEIGTDAAGELIERSAKDAFSAQVFKTIIDPFIGQLTYLRIFSGELKKDQSVYNVNKNATERIGALYALQGKKQIPRNSATAGDIVAIPKLAHTLTGDTLAAENAKIRYEPLPYKEPMYAVAVQAKKKDEEDKLFAALYKAAEEDPSIALEKRTETKEMVLKTVGEVQLETLAERLRRKTKLEMITKEPRVAYRETIRKAVKAEGKHKKQSGGHGQYGHVMLDLAPQEAGAGNAFTENIFGGTVPRQYIPAVEKGMQETFEAGILAGYPVIDVKVNLYDGSYHSVDSSEVAFKTATAIALRKGFLEASPVLLEPIYTATIIAPEYYMGDIIGNLKSKRAQVLSVDAGEIGISILKVQIPEAGLYRYATELRSLTQGRGEYTIEFSHYQEVPEKQTAAIIEAAKSRKD